MNFGRRLPVTTLATVVVGVLGLSACTDSTPSNRRMAEDIIETVDGLTDAQRDCMRQRLEDNYSSDDLEAINEENQNVDWEAEGATGGQRWQAFVADLAECRVDDSVADASEPDGTTAGDESGESQPAGSTEPPESDDSQSADSSEPVAGTEPGSR